MLLLPLSRSSALTLGLGLAFGFLNGVVFLGCEATRPLFSGVPVMKTRSLSYPSQVLPLLMQFWQNGRSLLHCFFRHVSCFLLQSLSFRLFFSLLSLFLFLTTSTAIIFIILFLSLPTLDACEKRKPEGTGKQTFTLRLRQVSHPLYLPGTPTILSIFTLGAFVCVYAYNTCIARPVFGPRSLCMCVRVGVRV